MTARGEQPRTVAAPTDSEPIHSGLRIAYLVTEYPKVSHRFIRREITALETFGLRVERFSLRACADDLLDDEDRAELERTTVLVHAGVRRFLSGMLAAAVLRPRRFFSALGLTIRIGWRSDRGLIRYFVYFAEAAVLLRYFARKRISHVHAHFGTNPAAIAMLCHALGGPPYSFTVHGPDEFDYAPRLSLGEKISRSRFVVTVSSFGRSQLFRWCDRRHWGNIHAFHPGIEDVLLQDRASIPDTARIICVGRLHENKGQLLLLEAVARLIEGGVRCELVLVGNGPLREEIRQCIARLQVDPFVSLETAASSSELTALMLSSRALVVPSFAENLPSVIAEAFALGRPVIATAIGGIPELVESRVCGWLIPAGSVEALADAIREALCSPIEMLEDMAHEGRRRVEDRFRSTCAARKLLGLINGENSR